MTWDDFEKKPFSRVSDGLRKRGWADLKEIGCGQAYWEQ